MNELMQPSDQIAALNSKLFSDSSFGAEHRKIIGEMATLGAQVTNPVVALQVADSIIRYMDSRFAAETYHPDSEVQLWAFLQLLKIAQKRPEDEPGWPDKILVGIKSRVKYLDEIVFKQVSNADMQKDAIAEMRELYGASTLFGRRKDAVLTIGKTIGGYVRSTWLPEKTSPDKAVQDDAFTLLVDLVQFHPDQEILKQEASLGLTTLWQRFHAQRFTDLETVHARAQQLVTWGAEIGI